MANQNHITKPLSAMFRDPSLRAAFPAAEDDGLAPEFAETDHPTKSIACWSFSMPARSIQA